MSNQAMTIEYAQKFFTLHGREVETTYDQIYENARRAGEPAEYKNDSYYDALQLTSLMIRKTQKSFRMLTGCTGEAFIEPLGEHFARMVERIDAAGGLTRVVVVNALTRSRFLDDLEQKFDRTTKILYAKAPDDEKVAHYVVADNMVRIEEPHVRLKPGTPANVIRARVLLNNPGAAAVYQKLFDQTFCSLSGKTDPATP